MEIGSLSTIWTQRLLRRVHQSFGNQRCRLPILLARSATPTRAIASATSRSVQPFGESRRSHLLCQSKRRVCGARAMTIDARLARKPAAEQLVVTPRKYKVAAIQISVSKDKNVTIAHAKELIEKAADEGAELIVLPEMWNCPYANDSFPRYAEEDDGSGTSMPSPTMLSKVAQQKGVTIIGGSIPERENGHLYNTCYIFGKNGELKGKHRKVHLFDIDIPGKITFKESSTFTPGENLTVVDTVFVPNELFPDRSLTDVGRIGVGICYDIRFPELAMLYATRGVHLIAYPGAFNMTTGPLHWELLSKARAVDNQVYVISCSPARDTSGSYIAWGHSTIVGPFGEILAETEDAEDTIYGEIDSGQIQTRRLNMPLESQRRGDLYSLVDISRS